MRISNDGLRMVKSFEGFRARPYQDSIGVWTIGYGETKGIGPRTPPWSEAFASARLRERLDRDYGSHVNALKLPLTQHQYDALTSFVYNVGPGGIAPDTGVGRALRARNWYVAADRLLDWDKAGGRSLPGLTRRRRAERALFLKGPTKLERWRTELRILRGMHPNRKRGLRIRALVRALKRKR